MTGFTARWILASLFFGSALGHAQLEVDRSQYTTPTRLVTLQNYPQFSDDYDFRDMETAIDRQLKRFDQKSLQGTIQLGGKTYPLQKAKESLTAFRQMVEAFKTCVKSASKKDCYGTFNRQIRERFNVFAPDLAPQDPRYGQPNDSFFTGYHTHSMEAASAPSGNFTHAIYANPGSAQLFKSRDEIDFHSGLKGRGLELGYITNLFDLYLLHVEGSGLLTFHENGKTVRRYLAYDGTNHQHWAFISKYMMDKGMISNPSIAAQRKYLRLHPEKQEEIYATCPSYVFFKFSKDPPPGCDNVSLTDGRSIATDIHLYAFKGLLAYVEAQRPAETGHYNFEEEDVSKIKFINFSRFFLDQDTGGAIRGKGRADIYFGTGDYAFFAATYTAREGRLRFLMLK